MIGILLHQQGGSVLNNVAYGVHNNFHENSAMSLRYFSVFESLFNNVVSNSVIVSTVV